MRKSIVGGMVLGALVFAGCQTGGAVALRDTPVVRDQPAQNPSSLERGMLVSGTVDKDYDDVLVLQDDRGETRYLRIGNNTRYFQDGKQVNREFLAPGASVRASYDFNNREQNAREIHIVEGGGQVAPVQLPARDGAPIP